MYINQVILSWCHNFANYEGHEQGYSHPYRVSLEFIPSLNDSVTQ